MRVIAGRAKGTQLQSVPSSGTRPISDRVKEALFDILGQSVVGAAVLDLFAGTGSVGIEALSRGARQAVFVDKQDKALSTIRANLQRTHFQQSARVVKRDVFHFLAGPSQQFDLIYVAPPQYAGLWRTTLLALDAHPGWVSPSGTVVVQVFPKEFEPVVLASLRLTDQRKYGSSLLCFYQPSP